MSKKDKKQNKGSAETTTMVNAPTAVGKTTKPGVLKVKQGMNFRGARAEWYKALLNYDGKPVADFLADTDQTPNGKGKAPSLPKSGVAEKPSGWLGYFQRVGAAVVEVPTEA